MDSAAIGNPAVTPSKRPLSETTTSLAPSPHFREATATTTRDDHAISQDQISPRTPKRTSFLARGLSLQMPTQGNGLTRPSNTPLKTPVSPKGDPTMTYACASPATALPRHSRGLDFSRASTSLHHSTLAESSPDSSPIITQKSLQIPSRKGSINSMMLDSPNLGPVAGWPSFLLTEKSAVSSSVGSVNMLASPAGSSDSDEDEISDEPPDDVMTTPQVHRLAGMPQQTPYNASAASTQSHSMTTWSNNFSPAASSLMKNFPRSRIRRGRGRSRKSSSSASGHSAVPSPRTTSPPPLRSVESASGYFGWARFSSSRRESLALGTETLNLSSSNDSGDEKEKDKQGPQQDLDTHDHDKEQASPSVPGVVRRVVTRRGNLLPKTKGFARIRAALMEESAPIDTETRREADTIKQVRERDPRGSIGGPRSPGSLPTASGPETMLDDIAESELDGGPQEGKGLGNCFGAQAQARANGYWQRLGTGFRTPPPSYSLPRQGSSAMEMSLDSPVPGPEPTQGGHENQISDHLMEALRQPILTKTGKRAREEDIDMMSIKRRAVSPSLSVSNSPVVGQSPRDRETRASREERIKAGDWGGPPGRHGRENSLGEKEGREGLAPKRSNSGGSASSMASGVAPVSSGGQPKRVGLQGMNDTNDGLMKMSIE